MNKSTFPQEAIDLITAAGYDVYMRDRSDTWVIYGNADGLGYVAYDHMAGYGVSTVHYPNVQSGTGYQIARGAPELALDMLRDGARVIAPGWSRHDTPRKYRDINEYRSQCGFNAAYVKVGASQ